MSNSFASVVDSNWDDIHTLTQLCIVIAQSSENRSHANVEVDLVGNDPNPDDGDQYNTKLMVKITTRVINLASHVRHLRYVLQIFNWMSSQKFMDINQLITWANQSDDLCTALSHPIQQKYQNEHQIECETSETNKTNVNNSETNNKWKKLQLPTTDVSEWNLIDLNEYIEIQRHNHMTMRYLSFALNDHHGLKSNLNNDGSTDPIRRSLECLMASIDLCNWTNDCIQTFNVKLDEFKSDRAQLQNVRNQSDREIWRRIDNGTIDHQEKSPMRDCYHFGANLCQKLNEFEKSLVLIQNGIEMTKEDTIRRLQDSADTLEEPVDSSDDERDGDYNDHDADAANAEDTEFDNEQMSEHNEHLEHNEHNDHFPEYELRIELNDDIKRMMAIKKQDWIELKGEDKLFVHTQREIFDMILTRGLAYSNMSEYVKAFHDSFLCSFIRSKDVTAWNNRAFAWYQMGRYKECIADCNYALHGLLKGKKRSFTEGLLYGNRGLAERKLGLYHRAVNDLNFCLKRCPQSRLAREALHAIWKDFTDAIYYGVSRIEVDRYEVIDIPFVIAKIVADYGVGIDFEIIPECHQSTIVYH